MTTASTRLADPLVHRYVTENSHAQRPYARRFRRGNAERQARHRARQQAPRPPLIIERTPAKRRGRTRRWNDALVEMIAVHAECAAWFEALPESLRDSATAAALQDMIDLDLDAIAAVQPPRGYGRDQALRHDVLPVWWRRVQAVANRGSSPCSPPNGAARGSGPAEDGGFDTARARPPG
jgi:hypothetical protein